jgi:hypothetical protein
VISFEERDITYQPSDWTADYFFDDVKVFTHQSRMYIDESKKLIDTNGGSRL